MFLFSAKNSAGDSERKTHHITTQYGDKRKSRIHKRKPINKESNKNRKKEREWCQGGGENEKTDRERENKRRDWNKTVPDRREERRFRATTAGQQPWENTLTARLLTQTKSCKRKGFNDDGNEETAKGKTSRKTYLAWASHRERSLSRASPS